MKFPELIQKIKTILPQNATRFELHEPSFDSFEENYVKDCIQSGWVSYRGQYVKSFEESLAQYCSVKYAISLVNGTSALYIALKVSGVKSGHEVIVPTLTFVATANAVHHLGATAHFVDSSYDTLGINIEKLEAHLEKIIIFSEDGTPINKNTNKPISAIVPVHILGHPAEMKELLRIAHHYRIPVVEDAAEGLGSQYLDQKLGSFGLLSCLSFNGNKIITTGGGGAILTNSKELADKVSHLVTTAKQPHAYEFHHDQVGYNFRLPNVNAAIGYAQMSKLENFVQKKRALAKRYQEALKGIESFKIFTEKSNSKSNYWLNALILEPGFSENRDNFLNQLHQEGLMCRPFWKPLHSLPMYSNNPRSSLEIAEDLYRRVICLPSSTFL